MSNLGYNPYRDEKGRFASGPSTVSDTINKNEDTKDKQIENSENTKKKLNTKDDDFVERATKRTQAYHQLAIKELNNPKYEDGTYDIATKKPVSYTSGYQVTFCQIGDKYSAIDYASRCNEFLKVSSDGKTSAGKFGGTPEISFNCKSLDMAIKLAKKYNQISIWDWAANNGDGGEIDCGGSGDRNKTRAQVEKEWAEAAKREAQNL